MSEGPKTDTSDELDPPQLREIPQDWLEDFAAAAKRPLPLRFRYAFIRTYKPVLDDAPFRAFATMEDYASSRVRSLYSASAVSRTSTPMPAR